VTGRIYLLAAWITSVASLGVAAFFDVSLLAKVMFASEALLWFATTAVAFRRIRNGRVREHREWMIRSFSLAFFFVTGSLWLPIFDGSDLDPLGVFLSWGPNLGARGAVDSLTRTHQPPAPRRCLAPESCGALTPVAICLRSRDGKQLGQVHDCCGVPTSATNPFRYRFRFTPETGATLLAGRHRDRPPPGVARSRRRRGQARSRTPLGKELLS